MPLLRIKKKDGTTALHEVDEATYLQAQNEQLRGEIETQRELNRHGFSEEDQAVYEQYEKMMED